MYCAKCGNEIVKDAAFCSNCGEVVKPAKTIQKEFEKKGIVAQEPIEKIEVELIEEYQNASQLKRFLNFLIDYVLVVRFIIPFSVGAMFPYEDESTWYVIVLICIILYFFLLETFTGRTLGKLITGTRVLNLSDEKPSAGRIFIRTLCRFIPFDALSYLSSRPVGWHDSISKTYVVEKIPN